MFITNMKPLAKYNCIKNYYRDILWEDKYLTEGVVRFLFKKITKDYITVFKPESLRLKRAMDFTMRKLKVNSPLGNSIGVLLGIH